MIIVKPLVWHIEDGVTLKSRHFTIGVHQPTNSYFLKVENFGPIETGLIVFDSIQECMDVANSIWRSSIERLVNFNEEDPKSLTVNALNYRQFDDDKKISNHHFVAETVLGKYHVEFWLEGKLFCVSVSVDDKGFFLRKVGTLSEKAHAGVEAFRAAQTRFAKNVQDCLIEIPFG